jgi:oligopeptide/dipeptide ABC transporter ATP-binding protein
MEALLDIDGLSVAYETASRRVTAVDNVNFELKQDEFLAVVGESGCGKSTLGLSVIGLLPRKMTKVTGSIRYKDVDLLKLDRNKIRNYRGTEIAMIFQEPLTSLSPVYRVEAQIAEAIMVRDMRKMGHAVASNVNQETYRRNSTLYKSMKLPKLNRKITADLRNEVIEYLKIVRIADPEQVLDRYPFELSGGMTQRVMIAMALSQEPALLIADEPTTALDVTTQAQVLKLMKELIKKVRTSIVLVTHDLAVASQVADRVIVMYAGEIAEDANVHDLFAKPLHPYTEGLLSCIPSGYKDNNELQPIAGTLPDLSVRSVGCKFAPRCPHVMDNCRTQRPSLIASENRRVSCFLYDK